MSANDRAAREQRKSERFAVTGIVRVIDVPTGQEIGQLVNISQEGLMILGTRKIPESSIMQLSLVGESADGGQQSISIGVESLWSQASNDNTQHWTGFCIIDISEQDRQRMMELAGR
ncbi:MAG: PilZ domain-containing protein [Thiohalobacterales bacterium]|nr:PilZ domain-containing protein [Thiohalobacterales bacterium]